jgi:hypothetical protein
MRDATSSPTSQQYIAFRFEIECKRSAIRVASPSHHRVRANCHAALADSLKPMRRSVSCNTRGPFPLLMMRRPVAFEKAFTVHHWAKVRTRSTCTSASRSRSRSFCRRWRWGSSACVGVRAYAVRGDGDRRFRYRERGEFSCCLCVHKVLLSVLRLSLAQNENPAGVCGNNWRGLANPHRYSSASLNEGSTLGQLRGCARSSSRHEQPMGHTLLEMPDQFGG